MPPGMNKYVLEVCVRMEVPVTMVGEGAEGAGRSEG